MDSNSLSSLTWIYDLYRIGQRAVSLDAGARTLQELLQHIVSGFQATSGSLALTETDGKTLRIIAGIKLPSHVLGSTVAFGDRIMGWVAQARLPLRLVGDISNDARFLNSVKRDQSRTPLVALCWPVLLGGRVLGVLSINRDPGSTPFTSEEEANAIGMGNMIALVIENLELHRDAQLRITKLSGLTDILETSTDLVATVDMAGGILYMNRAGRAMLDIGAEEDVTGICISDFYPRWVKSMIQIEGIPYALRDGAWQGESELCSRDGRTIPVSQSIVPHKDADGKTTHLSTVIRDISDIKDAEEVARVRHQELASAYINLEQAQSQLLQSEKMASIGQLAAGVAHEINNPVGYVNSNIGTLQGYVNDLFRLLDVYQRADAVIATQPVLHAEIQDLKQTLDIAFLREDTLNLVKESQEGITRVKKIVQDLKEFSHVDRAEWQQADLHTGLDSTLNIVRNELKYKADIVKDYGILPRVECIPAQLNQVFLNLLVNAAQAIVNRGTITLRTGTDAGGVFVEIGDNGQGMSMEVQKRIFEPFFTTKPVGKGTGLGLSLSHSIVAKHQGHIDVASTPGEGSTFRVWVPVEQGHGDQLARGQRGAST